MKCSICKKTFANKYNCLRHEQGCGKNVEDRINCSNCNKFFSDKHARSYHETICGAVQSNCITCQYCNKSYSDKYTRIRHEKTCGMKSITRKDLKNQTTTIEKIVKSRPSSTIINNTNIQNIINLNITKDTDFYQELKNKMGEKAAIDFIARAAIEGDTMRIFEKIYLDDKKAEEYPIACRDDEFRFKVKDKLKSNIAREMSDLINEKVVNCILNASIYIVNQTMMCSETERGPMFEGIYNLTKIQGAAQKLNLKKELFFNKLKKKIIVRNHPFFLRSMDELSDDETNSIEL